MAERMTLINLPGKSVGIANYGRRDVAEMLSMIRRHAVQMKEEAEAILAARDEDFRIETYVGIHRRRNIEIIQDHRGKKG